MCAGKMDGVVFPDPDNCDAFIQCQRGAVTNQKCQPGTSFDLNLFYCVPSFATDCGARSQSSPVKPPVTDDGPPSSELHHSVSEEY